jgi:hypothetical protein
MKDMREEKGSVLVGSFLIALIVGAIAGLYLESVRQELRMAHHARLSMEATNIAEIGAEDALYALINSDWGDWTAGPQGYSKTITDLGAYTTWSNEPRWINVFVRTSNMSEPVVVAEAVIEHPMGFSVTKQLRIDLSTGGLFANGLTARNGVTMNGNNVAVDSYHSGSGFYNATSNRRDNGSVASVSVAVGAVSLQNADIYGYVATGGAPPSVGSKGSVTGADTPSGVKVDSSRVSTDFYAEFPPVLAPAQSAPTTSVSTSNGTHTLGVFAAPSDYKLSGLSVGSRQTFNVQGDVTMVIDGDMSVKGEINLEPDSTLTLYISGDLDIGGNGITNMQPGSTPENVVIYSTAPDNGSQTMKLHGNGAISAAIYAPYAAVEMKGSGSTGTMMGAVIADTILLTGNFEFHFDEALKDYGASNSFSMDSWRELHSESDRYGNVLALVSSGL